MISAVISLYSPNYAATLVYMLQNTDYRVGPYLAWYWRTKNFNTVMRRRRLERTKAARLLIIGLTIGMLAQVVIGLVLAVWGIWFGLTGGTFFGLAIILSYPVVWAHLVALFIVLGRVAIVQPRQNKQIVGSSQIFKKHNAIKIAIAGSYGKTSMKEILLAVLGAGKQVAATPANKNVAISHAQFAKTLSGKEDILLIEFGEGAPGDVPKFAHATHPTHAVITGLAPAHLDRYKTLQAAGEDIFSLADYLTGKNIYVNAESPLTKPFIKPDFETYDANGALGWQVSDVKVSSKDLRFMLSKNKRHLKLKSYLLGRHQLGPLALAVALAEKLGVNDEQQIIAGVAATKPFEHRMQPYELGGATIIDDTYNGNIEGVRAGTQLLAELKASRKWYATPGLVDQGPETEKVHVEMGELISAAKPDIVVLMKNSTTKFIQRGLKSTGFKGELRIEKEPLDFYNNLADFVAAGDLVLMQNDWPDNYA